MLFGCFFEKNCFNLTCFNLNYVVKHYRKALGHELYLVSNELLRSGLYVMLKIETSSSKAWKICLFRCKIEWVFFNIPVICVFLCHGVPNLVHLTKAETNVQKASSNANRSSMQMEETITDFQRQKLCDVKVSLLQFHQHGTWHLSNLIILFWFQKIFSEFIMVEMLFHAKALEVYTHTFNNLETMDIDKDLEVNF